MGATDAPATTAVRGATLPLHPDLRADVAVRGVRSSGPVCRTGGAGPSDDGHVRLGGLAAALPVVEDSPWSIEQGTLVHVESGDTGVAVDTLERPAFYDLETSEGVPYHKLARLHGTDVLATTVIQTCMRYDESDRCRFCAIESSLAAGSTTPVKTPDQLAEVARAAVDLDGVTQMVLTTGTTPGPDRGGRYMARVVAAVHAEVPELRIQVQVEPPADLAVITDLHEAGATAIGIHVESMDQQVRDRWMPSKGSVPMTEYWAAWHEAVRVFGWNRVSTYLLVGLGEHPDELVAAAGRLIDAGVYPFVVPFRPLAGTLALADGATAPDPLVLASVTSRVAALLQRAGMRGADQGAGCAACGACSALSTSGG
jgi:radical SAM protein (TIGR04043 family)